MKIAVMLGDFSVGARPLDFNNIWDSPRGLTGTDLSTVMICKELKNLGHDISLFTVHTGEAFINWEGINVFHYINRQAAINDTFDVIVSINEPDSLRDLNTKALKICWEFLNDFNFCSPGFDDQVDLWLSPSQMLLDYLVNAGNLNKNKWKVLPLGCDPAQYEDKRISGRVIWTSSADRGLHWLLQEWPAIKKAVPYASLKVFYHFSFNHLLDIEPNSHQPPHLEELGQRLRYIRENIKKLKSLDVEHVGSVSRKQLAKEISEASVFAYSADTVIPSEGFSVSTLENLAGFTVPVVAGTDCLGSIYKDSGAIIINTPVRDNLDQFRNEVIKGLTDKKHADSVIDKCRIFAYKHSWTKIAKKMEEIIYENKNK